VREVLREYDILKPEEVGLPHERAHLLVNQIDIEFCFYDSVHVDVDDDVETVVDIGAYECQNELEDLGCDIVLHLANIDPFKCGLQVHGLCLWQDELAVEHTDAEGLQVDLVKELNNQLED